MLRFVRGLGTFDVTRVLSRRTLKGGWRTAFSRSDALRPPAAQGVSTQMQSRLWDLEGNANSPHPPPRQILPSPEATCRQTRAAVLGHFRSIIQSINQVLGERSITYMQ